MLGMMTDILIGHQGSVSSDVRACRWIAMGHKFFRPPHTTERDYRRHINLVSSFVSTRLSLMVFWPLFSTLQKIFRTEEK
jgi:hypothetical protein